jgi:RNA polymerase sigma-70 factor (ECF subfamily)
MTDKFQQALVALMPALRDFAKRKVRSTAEADDLVQETLARAMQYRASFQDGTNLKSWLCKILQNCLYRDRHKQRDTIADIGGQWAAQLSVAPAQEWRAHYNDMLNALNHLSEGARDILLLIGEEGCSYEEAAEKSHIPLGTLKSRVSRAREQLASLTGNDNELPVHRRDHVRPPPLAFQEQRHQFSAQNINIDLQKDLS